MGAAGDLPGLGRRAGAYRRCVVPGGDARTQPLVSGDGHGCGFDSLEGLMPRRLRRDSFERQSRMC